MAERYLKELVFFFCECVKRLHINIKRKQSFGYKTQTIGGHCQIKGQNTERNKNVKRENSQRKITTPIMREGGARSLLISQQIQKQQRQQKIIHGLLDGQILVPLKTIKFCSLPQLPRYQEDQANRNYREDALTGVPQQKATRPRVSSHGKERGQASQKKA